MRADGGRKTGDGEVRDTEGAEEARRYAEDFLEGYGLEVLRERRFLRLYFFWAEIKMGMGGMR